LVLSVKLVCIGVITGASGVRGEVRIKSFTEDPKDIISYGPVLLKSYEKLDLKFVRASKELVTVKILGVVDREKAELYKGERVYVKRSAFPAPDEEEFYHSDLIGLKVMDCDNIERGVVSSVLNFGAGDIIDMCIENGESCVVPFSNWAVPFVSISKGLIVVNEEALSDAKGKNNR
jgi:16S rRNA processing protein RimM